MTSPEQQGDARKVSDVAASLIRTGVPLLIGTMLVYLAKRWGIVIDQGAVEPWIVAATIGAYYALARFLEQRRGTSWFAVLARGAGKWMLGGVVRQPVYAAAGEVIKITAAGKSRKLQ